MFMKITYPFQSLSHNNTVLHLWEHAGNLYYTASQHNYIAVFPF